MWRKRRGVLRFVKQRTWRLVGAVSILTAGVLAYFGPDFIRATPPTWLHGVYWGALILGLLIAAYMALLDIRYIRAQFAIEERDLFLDTLGSEEFREALRESERKQRSERQDASRN